MNVCVCRRMYGGLIAYLVFLGLAWQTRLGHGVHALLEVVVALTRHSIESGRAERLLTIHVGAERVDSGVHIAESRHLPQRFLLDRYFGVLQPTRFGVIRARNRFLKENQIKAKMKSQFI